MTTPDLTPRVRRPEEDVTAVADTVLEIKHTVDGHTRTLAEHGRTLAEHTRILADHGRMLAEHGSELAAIRTTQEQHGVALAEILGRLDPR